MRIALIVGAVLGCGSDDNGPQADAPVDVPEDPVSIRVTRQNVPIAGLSIVFHRADGTLVDTIATDPDGRAQATTGSNGFVTAFTTFASDPDIKTFVGVQPGDQLEIDGAPNLMTPMTTYKVRVVPVAGAVFYRVSVRCLVGTGEQAAPAGNPIELSVTTTCLAPTETLVVALDSVGLPIESILGAEATPTENGIVDLAMEVAVTAETATLTIANAGQGGMLESARAFGRTLFPAESDAGTNGAHPTVFPDVSGASQTVAVTGQRPVFGWGPATSTQALDVAATQVAVVEDPSIERATRVVAWTGATDANFAFGQMSIEATGTGLWSFVGPLAPGASNLTLPALAEFPIDAATRINLELGVGRAAGGLGSLTQDVLAELRRDAGWLDANNGLQARQRTMFESRGTAGFLGLSFATANLSF